MKDVVNYMEQWVEECMNDLSNKIEFCECEQCRKDIYALALNNLPPYYVVTVKGKVMARYEEKVTQFETDILIAVSNAIKKVSAKPNHG